MRGGHHLEIFKHFGWRERLSFKRFVQTFVPGISFKPEILQHGLEQTESVARTPCFTLKHARAHTQNMMNKWRQIQTHPPVCACTHVHKHWTTATTPTALILFFVLQPSPTVSFSLSFNLARLRPPFLKMQKVERRHRWPKKKHVGAGCQHIWSHTVSIKRRAQFLVLMTTHTF